MQTKNFVTQIKNAETMSDDKGMEFGYFEGYASTFGNLDRDNDIMEKGCFKESLRSEGKIKLLWQHWNDKIIGQVVEAEEDGKGLFIKGRINLSTKLGQEAFALLKAGDIDEMSIGFRVNEMEWDSNGIRVIKEVTLFEVSLVTEPANEQARITDVKAFKKNIDEAESLKDLEKILKSVGFSNDTSCALVSKIKKFSLDQSESGKENSDEPEGQSESDEEVYQKLNDALLQYKVSQSLTQLKGVNNG